jgi:hypothetical protein
MHQTLFRTCVRAAVMFCGCFAVVFVTAAAFVLLLLLLLLLLPLFFF